MDICFYDRLQEVMYQKRIRTQKALSQLTGIDNGTISRWKRGKESPKDNSLRLLSEKLGCNFKYLKSGEGEPFPVTSITIGGVEQKWRDATPAMEAERFNQDLNRLFEMVKKWQEEENGADSVASMLFINSFYERFPEFVSWLKKRKGEPGEGSIPESKSVNENK